MTAFLDLFSGIGGFALGAYWAELRFDRHYFSEIDDYAVQVYQKRFPEAEPLGDIRNVDYAKLPRGEYLVTGGFPCQPHSVAGMQKGAGDERDLWPECARMLRDLRPAIAVFENVPGLFVSNRGAFFSRVLSDISEGGYDAEWQIISAQDAGAPHKRERVWIVAYPDNTATARFRKHGGKIFPRSEAERFDIRSLSNRNAAGLNEETEQEIPGREGAKPCGIRPDVPDTDCELRERSGDARPGRNEFANGGKPMADTPDKGDVRRHGSLGAIEETGGHRGRQANGWWAVEPDVGRVAHGIPSRVDRLKGCGNAIVPQCAEMIFNLPAFDRWRAV